jgi:hypothetical protein
MFGCVQGIPIVTERWVRESVESNEVRVLYYERVSVSRVQAMAHRAHVRAVCGAGAAAASRVRDPPRQSTAGRVRGVHQDQGFSTKYVCVFALLPPLYMALTAHRPITQRRRSTSRERPSRRLPPQLKTRRRPLHRLQQRSRAVWG